MEKIGMFWGSTTGNQEEAAKFLTDYMVSEGFEIDSYDIKSTDPSKMLDYSQLLLDVQHGMLESCKKTGKKFLRLIKS